MATKSTKTNGVKKVNGAKKAVKKAVKKVTKKAASPRKPNPVHDKVIKLLARPNGATLQDTKDAGFKYAVAVAVKIAERNGYKVNKKKLEGEPTRYFAKRSSGRESAAAA